LPPRRSSAATRCSDAVCLGLPRFALLEPEPITITHQPVEHISAGFRRGLHHPEITMRENFERLLPLILRHEGGYVDHPRDPGGATNLGVTIGTLSDWLGRPATKAEVKALTVAKVAPIYRRNYWDAMGCDALPSGVDYVVFDPAVNSGPGRARQWYAKGRRERPADTVRAVSAIRRGFLQSLRTFSTFGKGWMRRVAEVEAHALKMTMGDQPAAMKTAALTAEAKRSDQAASKAKKAAQSTGAVATAPPAAAVVADGWGWGEWIFAGGMTTAAGILVAVLVHRHMAERARAKAMRDETWSVSP
jgi:lysozyme family protein